MISLEVPDIYIVCFSLVDKDSLDSVEEFWIPEIQSLDQSVPIVLVGTQLDMRKPFDSRHITFEQGQKVAKRLGADYYVECSAKENSGIRETFQKAVMAKIRNDKRKLDMIKRMLNRWTRYSLWYYKSMTPASEQRRSLSSFSRAGTEYTHTRTNVLHSYIQECTYENLGYSLTKWTFYWSIDCKRQWLQLQSMQQEFSNLQIQNIWQQQIQKIAETDLIY